MDKPKVLIIVPSYREEENIVRVLQGLERYVHDIDVLIIIDGSKDRTEEIVSFNDYDSLVHPFNMGYGVAVQTGYKYAVRNGYDVVVQIDGDVSTIPNISARYYLPWILRNRMLS